MTIPPATGGNYADPGGSSSSSPNPRGKADAAPFAITGSYRFTPDIFPSNIRPSKSRNLDRTQNFCQGEDVSDNGSENRNIHVNGTMIGPEKDQFDALLDAEVPVEMTSPTWSGEVRVSEGEFEGPTGWDPSTGYFYYEYTLDLVATGADEMDESSGNGVVSSGNDFDTTGFSGGGDEAFSP